MEALLKRPELGLQGQAAEEAVSPTLMVKSLLVNTHSVTHTHAHTYQPHVIVAESAQTIDSHIGVGQDSFNSCKLLIS